MIFFSSPSNSNCNTAFLDFVQSSVCIIQVCQNKLMIVLHTVYSIQCNIRNNCGINFLKKLLPFKDTITERYSGQSPFTDTITKGTQASHPSRMPSLKGTQASHLPQIPSLKGTQASHLPQIPLPKVLRPVTFHRYHD